MRTRQISHAGQKILTRPDRFLFLGWVGSLLFPILFSTRTRAMAVLNGLVHLFLIICLLCLPLLYLFTKEDIDFSDQLQSVYFEVLGYRLIKSKCLAYLGLEHCTLLSRNNYRMWLLPKHVVNTILVCHYMQLDISVIATTSKVSENPIRQIAITNVNKSSCVK